MKNERILFKNATIIDGDNNKKFKANLLIEDDKIVQISSIIDTINSCEVIDCTNKIITPGFIDVHGHSDLQIRRSCDMKPKIQQGITTEIAGNCGVGVFPLNLDNKTDVEIINDLTKDVLGSFDYDFRDFDSFYKKAQTSLPNTNVLFLQSHTALRAAVIKPNPNRKATFDEIKKMCALLDTSLKQGCIGLSTGLYYAPCLYADETELLALLQVVKDNDKIFCTHHRCEGDDVVNSLKEVISLSKKVGVRLEISHLKAIGKENQKYVDTLLSLIDEAKNEGLDIGFDQYPYEFGSTSLNSLLPPKYLKLTNSELKKALSNQIDRDEIISLIKKGEGWDSIIKMCGFDNINIMYLESQRHLEGKTLREVAKILKENDDDNSCFEAFLDVLEKESGVALMTDVTQSKESIEKVLKHPLMCFGTDAIYSADDKDSIPTHPRSYQAAVHLIEEYYKKRKVLPLENLIYNMCGKSAKRFRIDRRGVIKEGYYADLLVIDINSLKDNSSLSDTKIEPDGIDFVFVNGKCVYKNKQIVSSHAGKILKY